MASIKYYVNGAGGTLGADLAIIKPLYMSGVIWYVGNSSSAASNSNAGTDRDLPLLTLQQAVTNAGPGDMIDLLANHRETIASTVTITDAGISIVGEGAGTTAPRLTNGVAAASGSMISVQSPSIYMDNIYFPGSSVAARERIDSFYTSNPSGMATYRNLSFECSANDGNRTMRVTSTAGANISGCTFTATGAAAGYGLEVTAGTGLTVDSCVFDAGSFNWALGALVIPAGGGPIAGIRMTGLSLLNGSNIVIADTGTTGIIQVEEQSGDSVIIWTP